MNAEETKRLSKFLSLVLRHEPQAIGIALDVAGWTSVAELLAARARHGKNVSRADIEFVVQTSDKKRFALSEDGLSIRASQGHSIEVDLGYSPAEPPELLFHGTVDRFLDSIRRQGLIKGNRHHVHLSAGRETALSVGSRRGKPVVLMVRSGVMQAKGHAFYLSANGVWLTEHVPREFIAFPDEVP
jgi:putative RNA 2'-phosphotransferase